MITPSQEPDLVNKVLNKSRVIRAIDACNCERFVLTHLPRLVERLSRIRLLCNLVQRVNSKEVFMSAIYCTQISREGNMKVTLQRVYRFHINCVIKYRPFFRLSRIFGLKHRLCTEYAGQRELPPFNWAQQLIKDNAVPFTDIAWHSWSQLYNTWCATQGNATSSKDNNAANGNISRAKHEKEMRCANNLPIILNNK